MRDELRTWVWIFKTGVVTMTLKLDTGEGEDEIGKNDPRSTNRVIGF